MNTEVSLPLKYRPSTFDEMVGQDHVTKILQLHLKRGSLPSCLIFYGPPGVGKTSLARLVAHTLNPSAFGCIDKDSAIEGGKDDIKNIQQDVYNLPIEGNYKTYIYDEAQEITRGAFASLLNVTEEPPEHVKFIFLTNDLGKIPDNIKSRAEIHYFSKLSNQEVRDRLLDVIKKEKLEIPDEVVGLLVQSASGSLRNGLVALETVVSLYTSGDTETDLSSALGILGPAKLSQFVVAYLIKRDFFALHSMRSLFSNDRIDGIRSINELQQFIMDARFYLISPKIEASLQSDLRFFKPEVEKVLSKLSTEKLKEARINLGGLLKRMYELSLDFENQYRRVNNKDALTSHFIASLMESLK